MINGLKISVSSEELRDHLAARAAVHMEKASKYREEMKRLAAREIAEDQNMTDDPVRGFRNKRDEHQGRADHFTFMADHVIPDEEYLLDESDLLKVEFLRRWL